MPHNRVRYATRFGDVSTARVRDPECQYQWLGIVRNGRKRNAIRKGLGDAESGKCSLNTSTMEGLLVAH